MLSKFSIINVTTSENIHIVVASIKELNIRFVVAYGPQENVSKEDREDFFDELNTEVIKSGNSGCNTILMGDLNAKIEVLDGEIISKSSNGELLLEMVKEHKLEVLNFDDKCTGYWTRVQNVNGVEEKSVIDYCITNSTFANQLNTMLIDEDKVLCPFRIIKHKDNKIIQKYSDHNALLVKFKVSVKEARKEKNCKIDGWKLTDDGLHEFQELTSGDETEYLKKIDNYNDLEREMSKIMDKCFQKRKKKQDLERKIIYSRFKQVLQILIPFLKKGQSEKRVAKLYIGQLKQLQLESVQTQRISRIWSTVKSLQDENGHLSIDKFHKMRKQIMGGVEEKTSIITEGGIEIFTEEAIKEEYRNEFIRRLKHRTIDSAYTEYERKTINLFNQYLEISKCIDDEEEFSFEEVTSALNKLKARKAFPDIIPPDVYKYAGQNLVTGITNTLNNIKNTLVTPTQWDNTSIKTLY